MDKEKAKHRPKVQKQVRPQEKHRSGTRLRSKRNETLELISFIGGFVVIIACLTALILVLLGHAGSRRGAILGASIGLLEAILNGPRPQSRRENLPVGTIFGRILLLALGLVPGGAALGALVGGILSGLSSASTVVQIFGHGVSGAVFGGGVALLVVQVGSATAAAVGTLRGHWKRHLLVEMADSAKGIWYEGGIGVAFPGILIGIITGIVLALMGAGGT